MTVASAIQRLREIDVAHYVGKVTRIMPGWLEADGPNLPVGALCRLLPVGSTDEILAEVLRVDGQGIAMAPLSSIHSLTVGDRVQAVTRRAQLPVGMAFLGRAIDALGNPIDDGGPIAASGKQHLNPDPPAPLDRSTPDELLVTGIRAIDGLHSLAKGQRIGVFAASGVGKTSLLSQLLRQVDADVCVCCLVGERGREVESIWSQELGGAARKRSIMVAATSDAPATLRVRAVHQSVGLARYFRDAGLHVLLVVDSMTRFAMALRELGLAAGEPPTVRGYTPNVFSVIPRIVEQAGAVRDGGSISAIMTVLSETDDVDDPLCELMKSLLDGHIILSRNLAERGHYPAIDPLKSISRNAHRVMSDTHSGAARKVLAMLECLERSRTMIDTGLYTTGSNPQIDAALAAEPQMEKFLRQLSDDCSDVERTVTFLESVARGPDAKA